eukprot:SAG31_NODE_11055_length_1070_cov_1.618950_1_plen_70_part_00
MEQILDRIYNLKGKIYEYKVKWRNFPAFEATFVQEQDSFRAIMEVYDAQFPRGSCRRDSRDDRLAYAIC